VRWKWAIGALLLIGITAALVSWIQWKRPTEPEYRGRPLSFWVENLYGGTNGPASREALRAMGPSAAQFFIETIKAGTGDGLTQQLYRSLIKQLPYRLQRRAPAPRKPEDVRLREIAGYLAIIGPEAPDAILAGCEDPSRNVRFAAVQATPYLGPSVTNAVPVLARLLSDPDPNVRGEAIVALIRIRADKTPALESLLQAIRKAEQEVPASYLGIAATLLGEIGPAAGEAAPRLRELLGSSNTFLRVQSSIALWQIQQDTNGLQHLIRVFQDAKPDSRILQSILPTLAAMGPAAHPAVPALQKKLTSLSNRTASAWLSGDIQETLRSIVVTNAPQQPPRSR